MAQGILPHSPIPSPSPPPDNSPGPSVKVEGGGDKGKGVKRGREENLNNDTIIISDNDDLDFTQVSNAPHLPCRFRDLTRFDQATSGPDPKEKSEEVREAGSRHFHWRYY